MNKPLRTILLIVLALVVVGAASYVLFAKKALSPTEPLPQGNVGELKDYTSLNPAFGFNYPDNYVLTERTDVGREVIVLIRTEDAVPPVGGEGPTAVTIEIYPSEMSVLDWITGTNESNFKLGNGKYVATTVAGKPAYTYTWSGLYEGKTTAFAHAGNIIVVSATWMTPEDDTLDAYAEVLSSFELSQ